MSTNRLPDAEYAPIGADGIEGAVTDKFVSVVGPCGEGHMESFAEAAAGKRLTQGFDRVIRRIHMAGLFGGSGSRETWCGRRVDDAQLPILGTGREANCVACARSVQARGHAARWSYDYQRRWEAVFGKAAS